ncbi:MAG: YraN family protein [Proteobacteria bacterium]|nr:YraN family protein [Pseudomonadota bacterium]
MGDTGSPNKPGHLAVGERAEEAALNYLLGQGMTLVERNFRCRQGEIDLVMRDGSGLVFVEVRYRTSTRFGSPLESVDARKRGRLVTAASRYIVVRRVDSPVRFDVVALAPGAERFVIQWVKDAFQVGSA